MRYPKGPARYRKGSARNRNPSGSWGGPGGILGSPRGSPGASRGILGGSLGAPTVQDGTKTAQAANPRPRRRIPPILRVEITLQGKFLGSPGEIPDESRGSLVGSPDGGPSGRRRQPHDGPSGSARRPGRLKAPCKLRRFLPIPPSLASPGPPRTRQDRLGPPKDSPEPPRRPRPPGLSWTALPPREILRGGKF